MNEEQPDAGLAEMDDLLRGLLCVPKKDLNEALEAERAERKPREADEKQ